MMWQGEIEVPINGKPVQVNQTKKDQRSIQARAKESLEFLKQWYATYIKVVEVRAALSKPHLFESIIDKARTAKMLIGVCDYIIDNFDASQDYKFLETKLLSLLMDVYPQKKKTMFLDTYKSRHAMINFLTLDSDSERHSMRRLRSIKNVTMVTEVLTIFKLDVEVSDDFEMREYYKKLKPTPRHDNRMEQILRLHTELEHKNLLGKVPSEREDPYRKTLLSIFEYTSAKLAHKPHLLSVVDDVQASYERIASKPLTTEGFMGYVSILNTIVQRSKEE